MKIVEHTVRGQSAARTVAAMLLNKRVIAAVSQQWGTAGNLFADQESNTVAGWAIEHFRATQEILGNGVETAFASWAAEPGKTEEGIAHLQRYIEGLNNLFPNGDINAELILRSATKLFKRVGLERMTTEMQGLLERNRVEEAYQVHKEYREPAMGAEEKSFLEDKEEFINSLVVDRLTPLSNFTGPLGEFLNPILVRNALVIFIAPPKTQKSFFLQEIALNLVWNRKHVAYLCVGDLSKREVYERIGIRCLGAPYGAGPWPKAISVPIEILPPSPPEENLPPGPARLRTESKVFQDSATPEDLWKAWETKKRQNTRSLDKYIQVRCWPSNSISWVDVKSWLERLDIEDNFQADAVVLDYADLLAPVNTRAELRHQRNETWTGLSNIRLSRECLIVTATQSDAKGYTTKLLGRENYNEDRRANDHATSVIGINMTKPEREKGICRLNEAQDSRHRRMNKVLHVAGCLDIANPAMVATF